MQFSSVWLQIKIYIAAKSIRSYTAISKLFMIVLLSYATVEVDPASGFDVPGQLPSSRCNWITSVLRPPMHCSKSNFYRTDSKPNALAKMPTILTYNPAVLRHHHGKIRNR